MGKGAALVARMLDRWKLKRGGLEAVEVSALHVLLLSTLLTGDALRRRLWCGIIEISGVLSVLAFVLSTWQPADI